MQPTWSIHQPTRGIINNGTQAEIDAVQPILNAANAIQASYC